MNPIVTIKSLREQLDRLEHDGYLPEDELVLTLIVHGSSIVTLGVVTASGGIHTTYTQFAGLEEF